MLGFSHHNGTHPHSSLTREGIIGSDVLMLNCCQNIDMNCYMIISLSLFKGEIRVSSFNLENY